MKYILSFLVVVLVIAIIVLLAAIPAISYHEFYRGSFAGCYLSLMAVEYADRGDVIEMCHQVIDGEKKSNAFGKDWELK